MEYHFSLVSNVFRMRICIIIVLNSGRRKKPRTLFPPNEAPTTRPSNPRKGTMTGKRNILDQMLLFIVYGNFGSKISN